MKAEARFKWNVLNASTQALIASTDTLAVADWSLKTISFQVPSDVDGIRIALGREGCTGPSCPASGTIIFKRHCGSKGVDANGTRQGPV